MDKLVLKDGFEIAIEDGASLGNIIHIAQDETAALAVCEKITNANVSSIKFYHGDLLTGEYENVIKSSEPTRTINEDGTVTVTISLREKTDIEIRLDALEQSQAVQDLALEDVGEAISTLMEG